MLETIDRELQRQYYALGKYDEAAANYQSAIQLEPNLFIAFYNLGNLRMLQEKYDKAVNNYRRAIQLGPSSDQISTIKEQGRHLIRIGRHPEAKALYAELSRSYPDDIEALIGLGKVNGMLGCMEEAAASCNRALALQPDNSEAHLILGNINFHNRRPDVALKYYQQALNSNPQNTVALNNFGKACLAVDQIGIYIENYRKTLPLLPDPSSARIIFSEIVKNLRPIQYDPWLDKELHSCFLTEGTDEKSLAQITTHLLILKYRLQSPNDSDGDAILETAENIAHDELFIALLRKTVNVNAIFEKLLRKIRYTVFANFNEEKDIAGIDIPIISALALQSLNNEYIIEVNEEEERRRRSLKASIELLAPTLSLPDKSLEDRILVYAMYDSLSSLSCKKHLCAVPLMAWSEPLRPLLEQALLNPLEEENIKRELPTIGRIEDQTSRLVQSQYEENPYPRWLSIPKKAPGTIKSTLMQLFPDFSPPAALDGPVKILVAGCGTGKHPIQIASHDNVEILAVDISKSSLAYAVRMARKYGIDNIQFMQGDILELADLDARFHIIESVGVLHHMKDPVAGWKILTKLLVKDGLMSIGLYSELARSSIVAARELIHHEIIAPSADNIRKFRQRVLRSGPGDILNELTNLSDFYSMSECRDLLFHYQEHRFTLPQINTILDDLSLSFIGFKFDSLKIENAYRNIFPQDKEMKNLLLWHQFETMHPNTFTRMYNFWCQARPL